MLTAYIQTALQRARCEWLPEDETFYCDIPALPGVWATDSSESAARDELQEALEDWIALGLALHQPFPILDGIEIRVAAVD
jgi:predicted RNase H-like HicB family nuclease